MYPSPAEDILNLLLSKFGVPDSLMDNPGSWFEGGELCILAIVLLKAVEAHRKVSQEGILARGQPPGPNVKVGNRTQWS